MIPVIDGREALPVRFLEYYTGRKLGPANIAKLLAHKLGIAWYREMDKEDKLTAYHLYGDTIMPMHRKEWDSIAFAIKSLSKQYKQADRHFDEWLGDALGLLPVAFVWRSEFDAVYFRSLSEGDKYRQNAHGYEILSDDEVALERQLIETPNIPADLIDVVFEGFKYERILSQSTAISADHAGPGVLVHKSVPDQELPPEIEIPLPAEEVQPAKQYPGRLPGKQYQDLTLDEYLTRRLQDTPPATLEQIVYELHNELTAIELGRKLQGLGHLLQNGDLKSKVSRLYRKEAERLGTAAEVIKGREN